MSDHEEQSAKLDLDYTPERAEELKENIEAVQKEIDDAWAEVESQGGTKVSIDPVLLRRSLSSSCTVIAPVGSRL